MKKYTCLNKTTGEKTELVGMELKALATKLLGSNVYVTEEAKQILISEFNYEIKENVQYIWISGEIHDSGEYFFGVFKTKESGLEDFVETVKDYGGDSKDIRGLDNEYTSDLGDKEIFLSRRVLIG